MNKKVLIIVGIVLGVVVIGAAVAASVLLQPKHIENRDYKKVVEVKKEETSDEDAYDLKDNAEDIGFEKVDCTNTTICVAKHNTYNEEDMDDYVSVMDADEGQTIAIGLHFRENDFTVDNIHKQVNAVAGNFIGIEIPKFKIEKVKNNLSSSKDNVSIDTIVMGNNTIEINMQKVENSKYYIVKIGVFPTTIYNQMMGA